MDGQMSKWMMDGQVVDGWMDGLTDGQMSKWMMEEVEEISKRVLLS